MDKMNGAFDNVYMGNAYHPTCDDQTGFARMTKRYMDGLVDRVLLGMCGQHQGMLERSERVMGVEAVEQQAEEMQKKQVEREKQQAKKIRSHTSIALRQDLKEGRKRLIREAQEQQERQAEEQRGRVERELQEQEERERQMRREAEEKERRRAWLELASREQGARVRIWFADNYSGVADQDTVVRVRVFDGSEGRVPMPSPGVEVVGDEYEEEMGGWGEGGNVSPETPALTAPTETLEPVLTPTQIQEDLAFRRKVYRTSAKFFLDAHEAEVEQVREEAEGMGMDWEEVTLMEKVGLVRELLAREVVLV